MVVGVLMRLPFLRVLLRANRVSTYNDDIIRCFSQTSDVLISRSSHVVDKSEQKHEELISGLLKKYALLPKFLNKNRFLLKLSTEDAEKCLNVLSSFMSVGVGFLKKWETGFSALEFFSGSPILLQNVLEHCKRFQMEPSDLRMRLQILKDNGLRDETVTKVLEVFPRIIMMNSNDICNRIEILKGIVIRRNKINEVCYSYPRVLGFCVEDRMKLLFNEFSDMGFTLDEIKWETGKNPQVLAMEVGEMSRCMELLRDLKCRYSITQKILSKGHIKACFEVKLRIDCLCKHGLIRREALKILRRDPRIILHKMKDIEKKIVFLTNNMGSNIECLIEVPEYLGGNLHKQIIPRYHVVEYLRSISGLGCDVELKDLVKLGSVKFNNLYVKPYPDSEKIYERYLRNLKVGN